MSKLEKDLRFLKIYAGLSTIACRRQNQNAAYELTGFEEKVLLSGLKSG